MRKLVSIIALVIMGFSISTCGTKESGYIGVNAEILEINIELKGFVVRSLDKNSVLGSKCYISCESDDIYYIYADNKTGETQDLSYADFIVGDEVTVDVKSVENNYSMTS